MKFFSLSLILFLSTTAAADTYKDMMSFIRQRGDYLGAVSYMENVIKNESNPQRLNMDYQFYGFPLSFIGKYSEAANITFQGWQNPLLPVLTVDQIANFLNSISVEPATEAVCKRAANHQIVIINEAHHIPSHRMFGQSLVPCLKKAGFKYFAFETLQEEGAALVKRGFVSREKTGFYSVEPQMASLMTDVLNAGFEIVKYDTTEECVGCSVEDQIDFREEYQANQLLKFFKKDPNAKMVIWVGYSHAYKRQMNSSVKSRWLAARLWEKTGIEPYSVEQLFERFDKNGFSPELEILQKKITGSTPVYFPISEQWDQISQEFKNLLKRNETSRLPGIDGVVVYPKRSKEDTRDKWVQFPTKRIVKFHWNGTIYGEKKIAQVFRTKKEIKQGVPLDQSIFDENTSSFTFILPRNLSRGFLKIDNKVSVFSW